jgi:FkbM family methyltransferase
MKEFLKKVFNILNIRVLKHGNMPWGIDFLSDIKKIKNNHKLNQNSLNNSNVIFDVGANIGLTTIKFKKSYNSATIHSFEPVKKTFNILKETLKQYNVFPHNLAFGSKNSTSMIKVYENSVLNSLIDDSLIMSNNSTYTKENIEIQTIDYFCSINGIKEIDILKIDTEGYDYEVLLGAENMIKEKKVNFIFFEFYEIGNKSNTYSSGSLTFINDYLTTNGYRFITFYTDTVFSNSKVGVYNALYMK